MTQDPSVKASADRLSRLLDERGVPGADLRRIDQRIWDLYGEECAVLCTDLVGFARTTATHGVLHFLQIIHDHRKLLLPHIAEHDGVLLKADGEGLLVLFRRARQAVRCAVEMQRTCKRENDKRPMESQMLLCAGIGFGRAVRVGDDDAFGAEVNAACALGEDVAEAYEILITQAARDAATDAVGVQFIEVPGSVPGSEKTYRIKYGF